MISTLGLARQLHFDKVPTKHHVAVLTATLQRGQRARGEAVKAAQLLLIGGVKATVAMYRMVVAKDSGATRAIISLVLMIVSYHANDC